MAVQCLPHPCNKATTCSTNALPKGKHSSSGAEEEVQSEALWTSVGAVFGVRCLVISLTPRTPKSHVLLNSSDPHEYLQEMFINDHYLFMLSFSHLSLHNETNSVPTHSVSQPRIAAVEYHPEMIPQFSSTISGMHAGYCVHPLNLCDLHGNSVNRDGLYRCLHSR